ncbi:hypothetical protein [Polaribacter sp. R77954]|uniref:hypothetical protein n=1 Tax=Polaribacter sp. R77954 TaxID=3093870 RepID=UPI0037CA0450
MKKISVFTLVAAVSLAFSSCSNEETTTLENNSFSLLKTYQIKRDATGAYSIDFDVENNTKVDKYSDGNNNEFLLSSAKIAQTEKSISQDLIIDNNNLEVSFVDANTNQKSFISISDDNIILQRKGNDTKLASYSVTGNQDGTYNLFFDVKDNVDVSFVYNESINTYEVHLEDGAGGEISYSRTLEKEEGKPLKIDFVNYISNPNAKSAELEMIRKPKVIIDSFVD